MIKRGKKAQGHVEMIMSFVLFFGAMIAVFIFLNPFAQTAPRDFLIDDVKTIFKQETEIEIGRLSIITKEDGGCYRIPEEVPDSNYVEYWDTNNPRKYTIYFSDSFANSISPHEEDTCPLNNFTLGVFHQEMILSDIKIKELKKRYESGYAGLRENLGMPAEFDFQFRDFAGNQIPELSVSGRTPTGVERDSKEFPVRVINEQGDIKELILNIRSW